MPERNVGQRRHLRYGMHAANDLRRGPARAHGRHEHDRPHVRPVRSRYLLRRQHGARSRVRRERVGSRRKFRYALRRENDVRRGRVRHEQRLGHDEPHLRSLRIRRVHSNHERVDLLRLVDVRGRQLREHGRHSVERQAVHGMRGGNVYVERQPYFVRSTLDVYGRYRAYGAGNGYE